MFDLNSSFWWLNMLKPPSFNLVFWFLSFEQRHGPHRSVPRPRGSAPRPQQIARPGWRSPPEGPAGSLGTYAVEDGEFYGIHIWEFLIIYVFIYLSIYFLFIHFLSIYLADLFIYWFIFYWLLFSCSINCFSSIHVLSAFFKLFIYMNTFYSFIFIHLMIYSIYFLFIHFYFLFI